VSPTANPDMPAPQAGVTQEPQQAATLNRRA
jgi:hypothetical protein